MIPRPLQANSSPLISTQNDPTCWPKMACSELRAANGTLQNMFHNNRCWWARHSYTPWHVIAFIFFLSFPGLLHGLCVCVCVCISYVSNVWEWRMFKTGMNSMCLHPPRTPSPVLSMQKQMASCGDAWGREGAFPKLVFMWMRVPVWRLSTKVPSSISKRPMRKGVKFLHRVHRGMWAFWLLSDQATMLCRYAPF